MGSPVEVRGPAVGGQRNHHECGGERSVGPALTIYLGVRLPRNCVATANSGVGPVRVPVADPAGDLPGQRNRVRLLDCQCAGRQRVGGACVRLIERRDGAVDP